MIASLLRSGLKRENLKISDNHFKIQLKNLRYRISRKAMARQMAQQTLESIMKEYIDPLGLEYESSIVGDVVTLKIVQTKEATFTLPLAELAEKMKDTDAVLDALKTVRYADIFQRKR